MKGDPLPYFFDYVKAIIYHNKRSYAFYVPFLAAYNPKSYTLGL